MSYNGACTVDAIVKTTLNGVQIVANELVKKEVKTAVKRPVIEQVKKSIKKPVKKYKKNLSTKKSKLGRNPYNFLFIFWAKWWLYKFILKG